VTKACKAGIIGSNPTHGLPGYMLISVYHQLHSQLEFLLVHPQQLIISSLTNVKIITILFIHAQTGYCSLATRKNKSPANSEGLLNKEIEYTIFRAVHSFFFSLIIASTQSRLLASGKISIFVHY
jgi:hypothetical protein